MKAARVVIGLAASAFFVWATVTRVDLGEAGQALGRATLPALAAAFVFSWLEVGVRAWRWRYLLSPLGRVGYRQAFAYTCVGYFANALLPMRLGEVARAYLAAGKLRLPRLATLGSIATERLFDGLVILGVATGLGFVVLGASDKAPLTLWVGLGLAALLAAAAGALVLSRWRGAIVSRLPDRLLRPATRLMQGTAAVRSLRGATVAAGATLVAYLCAVGSMLAVATSVGLSLSLPQAGFAIAWIGLSTAIPAAPGSVGTYEFVGVSVLTLLNQDPASALAAVVLLHVIGTLPVALVGLATTWALHLRVWRLASAAGEPASLPAVGS